MKGREIETKHRILIVEDDTALANGLCRALQNEQIETAACATLHEADTVLQDTFGNLVATDICADAEMGTQSDERMGDGFGMQFDLVLLDVNLPDGSGFDFLEQIKRKYDISVIILTANDMETDIVAGLEMGADDYITKPFSLAVLRARVETQLRRVKAQSQQKLANQQKAAGAVQVTTAAGRETVIDGYQFNFAQMVFRHGEEQVELSKNEQRLLRILVENRGITLTREQLLDYIWSVDAKFVDENALSVTVKRLRDKLSAQEQIKTVYGIGYRWE